MQDRPNPTDPAAAPRSPGAAQQPPSSDATPPIRPGPASKPNSVWPNVIGVISIVYAGLTFISSLFVLLLFIFAEQFDSFMQQGAPPPGSGQSTQSPALADNIGAFKVFSSFVHIVLNVALLIGAVKLLNRQRDARFWHRIFGWGAVTTASVGWAYMIISSEWPVAGMGGGAGLALQIFSAMLSVVLGVGYPVFLLLWFGRQAIRQEVAAWPRKADTRSAGLRQLDNA
jgi:hypothetical protein